MRTYLTVFTAVFLAELGDKTQLATLLFAMDRTASTVGVFAAAASALVLSTLIAALIGSVVGAWVPTRHLQFAAAVGFIAIGVWMLLAAR